MTTHLKILQSDFVSDPERERRRAEGVWEGYPSSDRDRERALYLTTPLWEFRRGKTIWTQVKGSTRFVPDVPEKNNQVSRVPWCRDSVSVPTPSRHPNPPKIEYRPPTKPPAKTNGVQLSLNRKKEKTKKRRKRS